MMAVKDSQFGIRHVTVVPTNFEPDPDLEPVIEDEEE